MAPAYGRRRRGTRLIGRVPQGHWKTTTFVAALRCVGIVAPFVIDRPMNGAIFRVHVERVLAPTLAPGDIVILDNLGSDKGNEVRRLVAARGAHFLFLPPYSPDLNPIERAFAKLKGLLRKAGERSVDSLWTRIGERPDAFSPDECRNFCKHAGYGEN